jgi:hypothetical protein
MKTIQIKNWKGIEENGKEVEENIVAVIKALLSFKDPKTLPQGFKQALMFYRLFKAFENKEELILEDEDYIFIKKMIETDTPAVWGTNSNIMKALEDFNAQDKI